jgi:hypothetical protein
MILIWMNKIKWGSSQASASLLFFLLQLTFLKSESTSDMVQFSILFSILNFFLLGVRRAFTEAKDWSVENGANRIFSYCTLIYLLICMLPTLVFDWNLKILLILASMFYLQLHMDLMRFSSQSGHTRFILTQIILSASVVISEIFLDSKIFILSIVMFLNLFVLLLFNLLRMIKLFDANAQNSLWSWSRFWDFTLASGFGFVLPLITLIVLDSVSVGILRTSQNFLALGSIFTASMYYSSLEKRVINLKFTKMYLTPSFFLLLLLSLLNFHSDQIYIQDLFGPFFESSLHLSVFLILALIPGMWVANLNVIMVKYDLNVLLLKVHIVTLAFLSGMTLLGYLILGISAFGIATFISLLLEGLVLFRILKTYHA